MKTVLGLDLGTNSIGWALVKEAENESEKSEIIKLGVRVNPLTVDELQNFEKGKSITTNADRTLKRSMRRNLQRYKLRRENLIKILKDNNFITDETILSENGNFITFETYRLRAKAATEEITLEQFARVLLMINKKRGYKSSRKAKGSEDGVIIDGMEVAKKLYDEHLTPGQYCLQQLQNGKKYLPDFYRSDLQQEFDRIYEKQMTFYAELFTKELQTELRGKKRDAVWAICLKAFKEKGVELIGTKRQGSAAEQKIENFVWRVKGLTEKLDLEQLVVVLQQINIQINNSSGYLGSISDRSKELFFNKMTNPDGTVRAQTVGEYQMAILNNNPHASLRNMVFYRQDYLDEFNTIWEKQAAFHKELTEELKREIRDVVIFYQRPLKSQKSLISFCEFESSKVEITIDGKKKIKTVGSRVIPRSSPLFQEFKIWQVLNNVEVFGKGRKNKKQKENSLFNDREDPLQNGGRRELYQEEKELLAAELSIKKELKKADVLKLLFDNARELDMNFKSIQGNLTQATLFEAYKQIIELSGHEIDIENKSAKEILKSVEEIFRALGFNSDILYFDSSKPLDKQPMYRLWHLLYSFEGDNSKTGNENLIKKITEFYGFDKESAKILAKVTFQDDYGSLSAKAIRKILPYLKAGNKYDVACEYAGYRHSASSLNKEELNAKKYKDHLEILPKNSLRNPVVEKILNQMINVINLIIDTYGKPDEIRIELARELKKNAKEREELTKSIAETTKLHEQYKEILSKSPFNLSYISHNDIVRYKLYEELKENGYKTLYSNTYISPSKVFSGDFDIEHIIPQSRLFDDSFSNKTLELRSINNEKGNRTAYDFIKYKYGESGGENSLDNYLTRIEDLYKKGILSKAKYNKLKMQDKDIPEGFINRDLANSQYIAKYAKTMLGEIVKFVVSTTGSITDRLREDWQLVDVMKELNWEKYNNLGLTEEFTNDEGQRIRKIKDWTKRNDHRHHAMDALTVAFTKRQFIQYLNNLNARRIDESQGISNAEKEEQDNYAIGAEDVILSTRDVLGIEKKYLYRDNKNKLRFIPPIPLDEFRAEAKRQLENTLISIKAKNKVVTQNVNKANNKVTFEKKLPNGETKIVKGQKCQTPRGQLHDQTVYGSISWSRIVLSSKISKNDIDNIRSLKVKEYLKWDIKQKGSITKAFSEEELNKLKFNGKPLKEVEVNIPCYTQRIDIGKVFTDAQRTNSAKEKIIKNILDLQVREVLQERLNEFNGDFKKAFSNLEEKPILNKNGKFIKRVTIFGVNNVESLHDKRDKEGKLILDEKGNRQPVDFVNTGNNHHVAIYRDAEGNLQEKVVSFFEAVNRRNLGLPVIDKNYNSGEGWKFLFSMKQNEYFVFPNEKTGFNPNEIDLLDPDNYSLISPNLFRVQKISTKNYLFNHHLETKAIDGETLKHKKELSGITYYFIQTPSKLQGIIKVRVNHLGQIVSVGEY